MSSAALAPSSLQSLYAVDSTAQQAPNPNSTPQTRQLYKECKQFEALLISNLWSQMEKGVGGADLGSDPGASTMQGIGIQEASLGLASAGGFGIARMLYQDLAPSLEHGQTGH